MNEQKPKALVFFDLDGTLLNDQSTITSEINTAIQQLLENNVVPFIATGRSPSEIRKIAQTSGITSFVALNGQFVSYKGREVYRNALPAESVAKLKKVADEGDFPVSFYSTEGFYATKSDENLKKAYHFIGEEPPEIDADYSKGREILMALVLSDHKEKDAQLIELFPEFSFYRNTPYSIDVISKGHSKATGIDELIRTMGLEDVPLYAFGDGSNDIEMLQRVDVAIAMENGIEAVKKEADYITASNVNGGIVQGLKKYDLI